jgi:ribosomal protein S12 methylthiotransferase accessory factor
MAALVGHLLAIESLKILSDYAPPSLSGRIFVQNLVTLESAVHPVVRMPWCDVCGGAAAEEPQPTGPEDQPHPGRAPRSRREEDVHNVSGLQQWMRGWIDARTGIIRRLELTSPGDSESELVFSCAAVLSSYTEGRYVRAETRAGWGKGTTSTEAMIGAVGEAIERYSAARCNRKRLHHSALNDLDGEVLDPCRLCLYDDAQYERAGFPFVRFDPARPVAWTRGHWLHDGAPVWLPALLTYFAVPTDPAVVFCQVTSHGLAAGAGFEDAALRAVFELVERDAFMLTWLAQRPGQSVLIDGSLDQGAREVVGRLAAHGVKVEVFLLDVGTGVPVIACLGYGDGVRWPGVAVGLGADLNPRAATRKAVLELGHTGPYLSSLMMDRRHTIPRAPEEVRSITDHALYYAPVHRAKVVEFLRASTRPPVHLGDLDQPSGPSLETCVARLSAAGVRVAIADVTSSDIAAGPLRVVRALGRDMQPFDFGFGLRRLANPRLKSMVCHGLNPQPHPLP